MSLMNQLAKELFGKLTVEQMNDKNQTVLITVQSDCIMIRPSVLKLLQQIEENEGEVLIISEANDDDGQDIQLSVECHLFRVVDNRGEDL